MIKRKIVILSLLLLAFARVSDAGTFFNLPQKQSATGTIKSIEGIYLYLVDEPDRFVRRFTYDSRGNIFKPGDRVRIHYSTFRNTIEIIKLMTPLEYKEDGQNLGYVMKADGSP